MLQIVKILYKRAVRVGCGSVVVRLISMCRDQCSISTTTRKNNLKIQLTVEEVELEYKVKYAQFCLL
jgi:hypothetical protein